MFEYLKWVAALKLKAPPFLMHLITGLNPDPVANWALDL